MTEVLANNFGNPSSTHTFGRQASQLVRQARETVAKALQVSLMEQLLLLPAEVNPTPPLWSATL